MSPPQPLPFHPRFSSADEYIDSLLRLYGDPLLQTLCGGVHILDFFTRDVGPPEAPAEDLYSIILPVDWRAYFDTQPIDEILALLLRVPLDQLPSEAPESFRVFVRGVREHSLRREFAREVLSNTTQKTGMRNVNMEWGLNVGMKPKKIHEVANFAAFVDALAADTDSMTSSPSSSLPLSHILDFGSGRAYLSRMLAKRYGHSVVGLESRPVNIRGAEQLDKTYEALVARLLRRWNDHPELREGEQPIPNKGSLQYIQIHVSSGSDLQALVPNIQPLDHERSLLLISLHSCGNLIHHALRAFACTREVRALALIGCCYNLMTERRGPTYKLPALRNPHPRLLNAPVDPDGFPISKRFQERNVGINITARSMACQAPSNWTRESSDGFFKRHFWRALLQRIFYDRGIAGGTEPVILGCLRKGAYDNFWVYVSAAIEKLGWQNKLKIGKEEVEQYEKRFNGRWKSLCVTWSLMAVTAGVCESLIVVDRWLYLQEQPGVRAWVEAAFEYGISPRNLVIVGIKE